VTLRLKLYCYIAVVHLALAAVAVPFLLAHTAWLFVVEAFFVASLIVGLRLVGSVFQGVERVRLGASFLADEDYSSRFLEIGQPELDQLIRIYNRMANGLREERIRLHEQNFFLERLMEASPVGVLTFDFDGRVAAANPVAERMIGVAAGTIAGKSLEDVGEGLAVEIARLRVGESKVVPFHGVRRVRCQRSQFVDRGFPRSFVTMLELTDELHSSERSAYEKLIRMMSHEVNNTVAATNSILHSCLNYSTQLGEPDREDFTIGLGAVIQRTDQLNAFMSAFADVVRIPPPKLARCEPKQVLEGIVPLFRADAERRSIEIVWSVEGQAVPVEMDRIQMEQVFVNILKNAFEAIGENGTVTIRLGTHEHRPFVSIEDTGSGLTPDEAEQLFTPFFTTKENGQGLGLTVVREILGRHGFEFSLSRAGEGLTSFRIDFSG
jgi:nitrogen fixation/metabolism regulation signal transduction histidine kinase